MLHLYEEALCHEAKDGKVLVLYNVQGFHLNNP